ncbi:MAG: hypothetical protein WC069_03920 [Candidatus Shapirobacteria bacterium]
MLNTIYTVVGIILGTLNIYQFVTNQEKEKSTKALVRSWQNHIEGIKNALLQLSLTPGHLLSNDKMYGSIQVLSQQACALDKAMIEQRFYDDKEIKNKRDENESYFKEIVKTNKANQGSASQIDK